MSYRMSRHVSHRSVVGRPDKRTLIGLIFSSTFDATASVFDESDVMAWPKVSVPPVTEVRSPEVRRQYTARYCKLVSKLSKSRTQVLRPRRPHGTPVTTQDTASAQWQCEPGFVYTCLERFQGSWPARSVVSEAESETPVSRSGHESC